MCRCDSLDRRWCRFGRVSFHRFRRRFRAGGGRGGRWNVVFVLVSGGGGGGGGYSYPSCELRLSALEVKKSDVDNIFVL